MSGPFPVSFILENTGSIIVEPVDTALLATGTATPNGIVMGSTAGPIATVIFTGDSAITPANPTVGPDVRIGAQIFGQTTAEQSLLDLLGISVNAGTIAADGPAGSTFTIGVAANGTIAGSLLNTGTLAVLAGNEMVIAAASGSTISSTGTINVAAGGTLAVDDAVLGGAVANNGQLLVVGDGAPGQTDTVEISGTLSGAGTLAIGTNGILKLDAATTEAIAFPTVGAGILILPGPGTYSTPLLDLNIGDKIELASGGAITGLSISGSTITIATTGGNAVLTNVSFAPTVSAFFYRFLDTATGDEAIQVAPLTDNWFGSSGDLGTAANWSTGLPSSAEMLNFGVGGGTLTGIAGGLEANFSGTAGWILNGTTLDLAGFPNPPFDRYALTFGASVTLNGSTLIAGGASDLGSNSQAVSITAQGGSSIKTEGDTIGYNLGQVASLILSGAGTSWTEAADTADAGNGYGTGYLNVGYGGTGILSVSNFASLSTGFYAEIGEHAWGPGEVTVSTGGQWHIAGNFP